MLQPDLGHASLSKVLLRGNFLLKSARIRKMSTPRRKIPEVGPPRLAPDRRRRRRRRSGSSRAFCPQRQLPQELRRLPARRQSRRPMLRSARGRRRRRHRRRLAQRGGAAHHRGHLNSLRSRSSRVPRRSVSQVRLPTGRRPYCARWGRSNGVLLVSLSSSTGARMRMLARQLSVFF